MANVAAMEQVVRRIEETVQRRARTLTGLRGRVRDLRKERRENCLRLRQHVFTHIERLRRERQAIRQIWENRATRRSDV